MVLTESLYHDSRLAEARNNLNLKFMQQSGKYDSEASESSHDESINLSSSLSSSSSEDLSANTSQYSTINVSRVIYCFFIL